VLAPKDSDKGRDGLPGQGVDLYEKLSKPYGGLAIHYGWRSNQVETPISENLDFTEH